ncbi:nephrin-like [Tachypleus tridentatus]|uniref:nephrin-like n=1 Tax=Tachypleus tridentatus TaxID=6853 RepID=UPI003FD599BD
MPTMTLLLLFASCLHESIGVQQHFIEKPQDTEVVQGQTGILRCQVGNLQGAVQWSKDGFLLGFEAAIPGYERYSMLVDVERGIYNLRIRDCRLEDEGEYQCQVGPGFDQDPIRAVARLTVLVPPDQLTINGRARYDVLKVHRGERITLACSAQGSKPPVQLKWYRNNIQLLAESGDIRQQENKLFTTLSTILLYPSLDDNDAIYVCEAVHPAMPEPWKTSVTISVLYPPETPIITGYSRKSIIKKGDIVSLTCISKGGNPPAQLRWFMHNVSLNGNYNYSNSIAASILTFTATADDNSATYRCEAINNVIDKPLSTSIILSVHFPPEGVYVTGPAEARRGDIVTVTCTTSPSNPVPKVRWRINGIYIVGDEEYTTETADGWVIKSKLTVSLTRQDADTKNIICRAGDDNIGYSNGSLQIKVTYPPNPPTILEYEEGTPILAGSIQRFICVSLGGNPPANLQWFRGERQISTQSRITGSGVSSELMIKVSREDNCAIYRCEASNSATASPLIAYIQLSVNFPPRNVTIKATPNYPREGEKISFVCITDSSQPPATVTWSKNNQQIESSQQELLNSMYGGSSTISRIEQSVTSEDDGSVYTCSVVNKVTRGIIRDVFLLSVLYKPVFFIPTKTVDIIETQNGIVNMSARGNPQPIQYTWMFRNIKIPQPSTSQFVYKARQRIVAHGPFLKIQNASRLDSGIYYCIADNEEGSSSASVNLNVLYPATILNLTQNHVLKEGEKFILECWIDANPITHDTVTWRRRGLNTVLESKSLSPGKFLLEIDKITRTNSGEYECVAFNGIGQHDVERVQISVMYRPVFLESNMETKIASDQGKTAVMKCVVEAMPDVTFDWFFNGKPIKLDIHAWKYTMQTVQKEGFRWINVLHIYDITPADFGTYTCDASNNLGKATLDLQLVKSSTPDPPFGVRACNITHISVCVSWKSGFDGGYAQLYDIYWKKEGDRSFNVIHNISFSVYNFKDLKPETKYIFQVVAKNQLGFSQPNEELVLSTKAVPSLESTKAINNLERKEAMISRLVWTSIAVCGAVLFILIAFIVACCLRRRHQLRRETEAALRIYQLVQSEEYLKMFNHVDGQPFFVSGRTAEGVSREEGNGQDIQMTEREEFWKRRELDRPTRSGSCSSQLETWGDEEIRRLKDGVPLEERYDCPDLLKKGSVANKEDGSKKSLLTEESISAILSYVGGPVISTLPGETPRDDCLENPSKASDSVHIVKLSNQQGQFLDHRVEFSREIIIP